MTFLVFLKVCWFCINCDLVAFASFAIRNSNFADLTMLDRRNSHLHVFASFVRRASLAGSQTVLTEALQRIF